MNKRSTKYNEVSNLKGVTISDVYVHVKEDTKYGFIDEKVKTLLSVNMILQLTLMIINII